MMSIFDHGPPPPCPAPFNMAAYVLAHAKAQADRPALELIGGDPHILTYSELLDCVACTAGGLRALGLPEGARVLFRLGNTPDFPIAYLGCIWAGLVPVPASSQLTRSEITEIARQTTPALVLCQGDISLPDHAAPVLEQLPKGDSIAPVMGDPHRLAYIIFTSGTSGRARGVRHAHRAIWARRMMWYGWYGLTASDRVMHAGAFNWTYTLGTGLMDPWSVGATALIPRTGTETRELAALAATYQATIFAAAPGIYRQMLKSHLPAMPALRHGLSAGESLPHATRARWQDATGTDLHEALGMSECSTFISGSPDQPAALRTSGRPQQGRRIAVLGDDQPVPFGTAGHLAIHRDDPGLMLGYLDEDLPDGDWFTTGDTVAMSGAGDVTYLGRADDMMNAGGYRVSPLEVEAAFAGVPGLTETAAAAVNVRHDAQVIALFYTSATPVPEDVLRAHAQTLLARYKQPRLYIHRPDLPKGGNGKLNRRLLRDTFEAPS